MSPRLKALVLVLLVSTPYGVAQAADVRLGQTTIEATAVASVPKYGIFVSVEAYDDRQIESKSVRNSGHDARELARLFAQVGMSTELLPNPERDEVLNAVKALAGRALQQERNNEQYPTVVIYIAGHGFRIDEEEYLAPRDFRRSDPQGSSVKISELVEVLAKKANVYVFFDACRTRLSPTPTRIGESIDDFPDLEVAGAREMVPIVRPSASDESDDFLSDRSLTSFAATRGRPALGFARDGDNNSPYAAALMDALQESGLELKIALGRVSEVVRKKTLGRQKPVYSEAGAYGEFYFKPTGSTLDAALQRWKSAQASGDREVVELYILENPSSPYLKAALAYRKSLVGPASPPSP